MSITQPFLMAIGANFILGVSSIYWHLFYEVQPITLLIYRVAFSLILLILIIVFTSKIIKLLNVITVKAILIHILAAVFVAINWGTFIWASIHGNVFESGLGYLIAPIFIILIGTLILHETISKKKILPISIIALSLFALVFNSENVIHWIYWTIGITWGAYAVLKKCTPIDPVNGLFIETVALSFIGLVASQIIDIPNHIMPEGILITYPALYLCGVISVIPLVMFSYSAQRLTVYNMGVLQFVIPTTQICVSILYYQQYVAFTTYLCFGIIWFTLTITTYLDIQQAKPRHT